MQSKIGNIISGKSGNVYDSLLRAIEYKKPDLFVHDTYSEYEKKYESNVSINGRIFEYIICETLAQEGICPFYYQAIFERVPNAEFDIILYHRNKPVILTMKTSLRERYKQRI